MFKFTDSIPDLAIKLLDTDDFKELKPELTDEQKKTKESTIEATLGHLQKLMDAKNEKSQQLLIKVREEQGKQYEALKTYHPPNKNFVHWKKEDDKFDKFEKFLLDELSDDTKGYTLALIDFYADWCPPCRNITRDFILLSTQNEKVLFFKINTDECKEICKNAKYNIECMPTYVT